jgi:hypothetical protein
MGMRAFAASEQTASFQRTFVSNPGGIIFK